MNLFRFTKITFITVLISFLASSCLNNDPPLNWKITNATILLNVDNLTEIAPNEAPFYFLSDTDSTRLYPTNYGIVKLDEIKNNQRCVLIYIEDQSVSADNTLKSSKEPLLIEIIETGGLLTRDILQTSKIDTVKNNVPVRPLGQWYSGGVHGSDIFLNIHIEFIVDNFGGVLHYELIDNLEDNAIKDGYYPLEFRLSSKNDMYYGKHTPQVLSFPITEEYLKEDIKGLRISYKNDGGGVLIQDYLY